MPTPLLTLYAWLLAAAEDTSTGGLPVVVWWVLAVLAIVALVLVILAYLRRG